MKKMMFLSLMLAMVIISGCDNSVVQTYENVEIKKSVVTVVSPEIKPGRNGFIVYPSVPLTFEFNGKKIILDKFYSDYNSIGGACNLNIINNPTNTYVIGTLKIITDDGRFFYSHMFETKLKK